MRKDAEVKCSMTLEDLPDSGRTSELIKKNISSEVFL
jgi:hypothetical protein